MNNYVIMRCLKNRRGEDFVTSATRFPVDILERLVVGKCGEDELHHARNRKLFYAALRVVGALIVVVPRRDTLAVECVIIDHDLDHDGRLMAEEYERSVEMWEVVAPLPPDGGR